MSNNEIPLIWTTKGNLPVDSLEYTTRWEDTDDFIKLVETYRLDGEIVKENAHIYAKRGVFQEMLASNF